jgi:two-component system chemotaxis response regulator CheB
VLLTGWAPTARAGSSPCARPARHTIAQDEASSVVYGMPREAARLGAAAEIAPLGEVPAAVLRALAASTRGQLAMV